MRRHRLYPALIVVLLSCLTPLAGRASGAEARQPTARAVYVALGVWDADGYGTDDPETQSMPAQLARHLAPGSRYFNAATGTEILEQALLDQVPFALSVHPTIVTIGEFGWVNLVRTTSALDPQVYPRASFSAFERDLDSVLAAFQRIHARVFVANLPNMLVVTDAANGGFGGSVLDYQGSPYNAAIAAVAARHGAVVVDIYAASHLLWPHPEYAADYPGGYNGPIPSQRYVGDTSPGFNARGNAALADIYYRTMHAHGAL